MLCYCDMVGGPGRIGRPSFSGADSSDFSSYPAWRYNKTKIGIILFME